MNIKPDIPLLIISLLLAVTLGAYASDIFPYPFGFLILCALFVGRFLHIAADKE